MKKFSFVLFLLLLQVNTKLLAQSGISTNFGEIIIENLEPGKTYSLMDLANYPFVLTNTGDHEITVSITPIIPAAGALRNGFEAVADINWIKMDISSGVVVSSGTFSSDIHISIPKEDKYLGKSYQVNIYSRDLDSSLYGFAPALESRLLFTVAKEYSATDSLSGGSIDLNLNVEPKKLYGVISKPIEQVKSKEAKGLLIKNNKNSKIDYKFEIVSLAESYLELEKGYESLPEASWLKFSEAAFTLKPGKKKLIKLSTEIPSDKYMKGKKYMAIVYISQLVGEVSGGVYNRVLIELK